MIHPHDLESNLEPWTVRVTYLARELRAMGHEIVIAYHALGHPGAAVCLDGTDILTVPLVRYSRTLLHKTKIVRRLAQWADLVHFQKCLAYTALPAVKAAYSLGLPLHYDWDDWESEIYNYRPPSRVIGRHIDRVERALPSLVDTVSVASEGLRELAVARGVPPELIVKVPVGADTARFHPGIDGGEIRRRHDIEGPIVLYVGQLHGAQYLEHLLESFVAIRSRQSDVTLLVVGGGDRFGELHSLSERLGISDAIVFTGPVPHEEVPLYMAAGDVAVACFDDNAQTRCKSPLKIVEYLAMGKAIVGTEMGEAARMLSHGAGLTYRAGDLRGLGEAVSAVLECPDRRRALEAAARKRSEEVYNWRESARSLAQAYEMAQIMGAGRRRRSFRAEIDLPGKSEPKGKNSAGAEAILPQTGRFKGFVSRNLDLVGIFHGEQAVVGPRLVQLDVTNNCNNDCIACWCNTPLLGDQRMSIEEKRQELPYDRVVSVLEELWDLGTREIYMAGGGEPFMHPRIMDIIRTVKRLGFTLFVNTNFTLVDRDRARELVELGVDHLTVSVWAGTAPVYALVHPNKTEETFEDIRSTLQYLNSIKTGAPLVKLYQVISSLNFHEIPEMVRFARETGSESLEYTLVDVMPGATECLLLDEAERVRAVELLQEATSMAEGGPGIYGLDLFERRLSNSASTAGQHDSDVIHSMPCTIGWTFARIMPDGSVNPCLKAHRIPTGSILHQSFNQIWNGRPQRDFRRHTNVFEKKGPFFQQIGNDPSAECGCVKSCDDIRRNQTTFERIQALPWWRRRLLARAARKLGKGGAP